MNLETLQWLGQWFFKRKCSNLTKIYYVNKYTVDNEDSEPPTVEGFMIYL
jgi:hypothetical protein